MKKILLILSLVLCTLFVHGQLPGVIASQSAVAAGGSYGSELIQDGDFSSGTQWTNGAAWLIDAGVATYNDIDNAQSLSQSDGNMLGSIAINTNYKLEFDISITAGTAQLYILNASGNVDYIVSTAYVDGHHELFFTAPADIGTGGIAFYSYTTSSNSFSIDNISLKEVL